MNVFDALTNSVSFPMTCEQVEMISIQRGLELYSDFTYDISQSAGFQLAKADMIRNIVTMPNVSEGGVSISFTDRKSLIGLANGIYSRYEPESMIREQNPTVTPIVD